MDKWPFTQSQDHDVATVRQVIEGSPIMLVWHDTDGMWQFLPNEPVEEEDARIITLAEIVATDPTVCDLADLQRGWCAWREDSPEWNRAPAPTEDDDDD